VDPLVITGLATASGGILTALGMLLNDRRKGRLGVNEHQRLYIDDQQADIDALRRDLSQLWDWAVRAIRTAAAGGVQLDPLPAAPPRSTNTEREGEQG